MSFCVAKIPTIYHESQDHSLSLTATQANLTGSPLRDVNI